MELKFTKTTPLVIWLVLLAVLAIAFMSFPGKATMIVEANITDTNTDNFISAMIDNSNTYGYFVDGYGFPSYYKRINLSTFLSSGTLSCGNAIKSLKIDDNKGWGYALAHDIPSVLYRIKLSDFSCNASVSFNWGGSQGNINSENYATTMVIDKTNQFIYSNTRFRSGSNQPRIVKFDLNSFSRIGYILTPTWAQSSVIDVNNGNAYFGLDDGRITKIRLSDFTIVSNLSTSTASQFSTAIIDTIHGYAYFATSSNKIIKIRLSDFTEVGSLTTSTSNFQTSVIDSTGTYGYFASDSEGKIIKIKLSDLSESEVLTTSYDRFASSIIDTSNQHLYFGTDSFPSKIVKVNDIPNFDPSGYIKNSTGDVIFNAKVQLSNATWTDPCFVSCFSDINGYWATNIGADGVYNYNVSKAGYTTLAGNQAFTQGGINNNFTLVNSMGRIYGTVYTYNGNLSGTKAVPGDLKDFKTQSQSYTVGTLGTITMTGGYVIKVKDIATDGNSTILEIFKDGNAIFDNEIVYPNQKYRYKVAEGTNDITYIAVTTGTIFTGGEISNIKLSVGFEFGNKIDNTNFITNLIIHFSQFNLQALAVDISSWLLFSPEKTTNEAVTFNASSNSVVTQTQFDFVSGSYTSFYVTLDAESTSGNSGKVGIAVTDDDIDTQPNFKDFYVNDRKLYPSDYFNFDSVDANGNKKVKVWMIWYQGYSGFKVYNYYATAFCAGCQTQPLADATVYYSFNQNTLSGITGAYSLNVPLSNNLIKFYKNGYESKNTTHDFSASPEFKYDIYLNLTNVQVNTSVSYINIVPDPVTSGQQLTAYYKTLDTWYQYRISICQFNQIDNCIDTFGSSVGITPNKESNIGLPNYPIGTYSAYLTGSNFGLSWDIVASDNFTVLSSTPVVSWSASKYYLNDTMQLNIYNPTDFNIVTITSPNGSIIFSNNYSAASTLYNHTFLAYGIPTGIYLASITNGNQATTQLLNIDKNNYSLVVPASLMYGDVLNIQFTSPTSSDLIIFDDKNNPVKSFSNVINSGTKQYNTSNLDNRIQNIKVQLIQSGIVKAEKTVSIGATSGGGGAGATDQWGKNLLAFLTMPAFWGLAIFLVGLYIAGQAGTRAQQAIPYVAFILLNIEAAFGLWVPFTLYILAVIWIGAGLVGVFGGLLKR